MKKLQYLLVFCVLATNLFSQEFFTPLYFEDKDGLKDTLWVGMDSEATKFGNSDIRFGEVPIGVDSVESALQGENSFKCFLYNEAGRENGNQEVQGAFFCRKTVVPPAILGNHYIEYWRIQIVLPHDRLPVKVSWDSTAFVAPYRDRSFITNWVYNWFDCMCGDVPTIWAFMADTSSLVVPYYANLSYHCDYGLIGNREMSSLAMAMVTEDSFKSALQEIKAEKFSVNFNKEYALLTISAKDKQRFSVNLFDVQGRCIYRNKTLQTETQVPMQNLWNGVYVLEITTESGEKQMQKIRSSLFNR